MYEVINTINYCDGTTVWLSRYYIGLSASTLRTAKNGAFVPC